MASFEQHARDCERFLGDRCEDLNAWMDEYFRTDGPYHRKFRHHWEGIREAGAKFGELGYYAAIVHILRDCRNVPHQEDYDLGRVDALGLIKGWPNAAYIKYEDKDFETLVMNNLLGSTGTVLWSFINPQGLPQLLLGMSRLTPPDVESLLPKHAEAMARISSLNPVQPATLVGRSLSTKLGDYFKKIASTPMMTQTKQIFPMADLAYVPVHELISPLVYIDHEYVEELRPELASLSEEDVAKFALPESINLPIKATVDPTQHNVNFISSNKTLSIGPAQLVNIGGGIEIRFFVAANLSAVTVSKFQDRLILRNGIHRAYLLAKLGITEIPCIFVPEDNLPNLIITAYPAFTPQVLLQPRPPLLLDFFTDQLCLEVPLQKTRKLVKVSAEEFILPVD
jgi:hypothetical protein